MLKYFIAMTLALVPTAAQAQGMMISASRQNTLTEAAKTICRTVLESRGTASDSFKREVSYLRLNSDEELYMLSLCILYAQGRVDELKAQR